MLPRVVVAPASLVALRKPEVSLASAISASEAELLVSVIRSLVTAAVTPAADELIRDITVLMVSFALTAMLVPLIVNEPAVTCAPPSNRGLRYGSALLNVALVFTAGLCVTAVGTDVSFFLSVPLENVTDSPMSAPRETASPAATFPSKPKILVPFWSFTSNCTRVARKRVKVLSLFRSIVSDVAFAAVLTPVYVP